ncbi:MAG: hypothetical protein D6720_06300 [Gammaproteobacteria bacterium]|nr:MAG: hypothetical protein D6720_06300 [Gammaproteobacteria bacterium]
MALLSKRKAAKESTGKAEKQNAKPASGLGFDQIDYFAQREAGRLNFELISLHEIEMDPTNPRTEGIDPSGMLSIIPKFLVIDPHHAKYDAAAVAAFDREMAEQVERVVQAGGERAGEWRKLFDNLLPLRDNIRLLGVKQPIEVRKTGPKGKYRIVYGHRRYLASILAGERNIPARIVSADAHDKHVQASENLHQETLTLAQRLKVIEQLLEDLAIPQTTPATRVSQLTGYAKSQMTLYLTVLRKATPVVREAIDAGRLGNLEDAAKIAKLPPGEQAAALEAYLEGGVAVVVATAKAKEAASKGKGRGRPKTYIATPRIKSPKVVKKVLERLGAPEASADIDWNDIAAAETVWKAALERLIEEVEKG